MSVVQHHARYDAVHRPDVRIICYVRRCYSGNNLQFGKARQAYAVMSFTTSSSADNIHVCYADETGYAQKNEPPAPLMLPPNIYAERPPEQRRERTRHGTRLCQVPSRCPPVRYITAQRSTPTRAFSARLRMFQGNNTCSAAPRRYRRRGPLNMR